MLTTNWNHTTKPSMFEVRSNGNVIFSGTYREGMDIFVALLDLQKKSSDNESN